MISIEKVIQFRESLRHFEREIDTQNNSNCCHGVTLSQCHTLMELDKADNVSLNELAGKLFLDKSTLSRIIEGLVNLNYVTRETPQNNRRSVIIKLTKEGSAICQKINDDNNRYFQEVLNSLPEDQAQHFADSFKTIVSKMIDINNLQLKCNYDEQ